MPGSYLDPYLDKLVGRTFEVVFCPTCDSFTSISMDNKTPRACPHCGTMRERCTITVE